MQALLRVHDDVCNKRYEEAFETVVLDEPPAPMFGSAVEQHRFVNIYKEPDKRLVRPKYANK
jgi:hypothetical protein